MKMQNKKTPRKKQAGKKAQAKTAIDLLKEDHAAVQALFKQFKQLAKTGGGAREKRAIVREACDMLDVHARIEEELFYPVVRRALQEKDLMDEALVEHDGAIDLVAQLRRMEPGDRLYDAKFTVLGKQVRHHIREEERKMFPKVKKAGLDLVRLGADLERLKREIEEEMRPGARQGRDFAPQGVHAFRQGAMSRAAQARPW